MNYKRIIQKLKRRFFLGDEPLKGRQSFALNELDVKLHPYLCFNGGVFVEAGANDGITQSNTLYFEKYQKWTGILVEPIPELYEQCKSNRPKAIVENYALVPFSFAGDSIEMKYSNLMSLVKGAMKSDEADVAHVERGCAIQQINTYEIKVPASTLTKILDKHHIKRIDILSLDVEGFELEVLKGLDFNKYRPKYILVEARFREEIDQYLEKWYDPLTVLSHHDILYKAKFSWKFLWS